MKKPKRRKGFTGTRGKPAMVPRGWDGTATDKARIDAQRNAAKGTYSIVSAAAACDRGLGKVTPFVVLAVLGKYRNATTTECFPSHATLAARLGIDRRSVQRHLDKLVEHGYLVILPRRGAEGQTSNAYVTLFPPLADIEGDEAEEAPAAQGEGENTSAFQDINTPLDTERRRGMTLDVEGVPDSGSNSPAPLRHAVTDPAVPSVDPPAVPSVALMFPSNCPTMNDPSAEADALARAAAADDTQVGIGDEGAKAGSETPAKLPPKLASHLRALAKVTGTSEADFTAMIRQWAATLVRRGLDPDAALDRVSWSARRVPVTAYAREALAEAMGKDTSNSGGNS